MSRYEFTISETLQCTVGWDPPLGTFFAQVRTPGPYGLLFWIGTSIKECADLNTLYTYLKPYTTVPDAIKAQLQADQAAVGFQPNVGTRIIEQLSL